MAGEVESFIFGGNTGLSYSDLKRRRAIAAALASRAHKYPTNLGEGLTYFAENLREGIEEGRLNEREKEQLARERSMFEGGPGPTYTPGAGGGPPTPPMPPMPTDPAGGPPPGAGVLGTPPMVAPTADVNTMFNPAQGALPPGGMGVPPVPAAVPVPPVRGVAPAQPVPPIRPIPPAVPPRAGASGAPGSRDSIAGVLAGASQGASLPQETAFPQTASLGRPDVASDAPSPGAGPLRTIADQIQQAQARTVPMTASDMPTAPLGGSVAPSPSSSAAPPAPPPAGAIPPPQATRAYPDPGKPPAEPALMGPSPSMQRNMQIMNADVSPEAKGRAQNMYQQEKTFMDLANQRAQERYKNQRETWERNVQAAQEWKLKEPERVLQEQIHRLTIDEALFKQRNQPVEAELARIKLDAAKEELTKTRIDIQQAERNLAKPDVIGAGGTQFERPAGAPPGTPYQVAPGLPRAKEEALTETQAKAVQFVAGVKPDLLRLEEMQHGKILTKASEAMRDLPGVGNILVTPEYQAARNSANRWGAAFMTQVSGAAVTPSEAERQLPAFLPQVGDSDKELQIKSERRRAYTDAVERTSSQQGMDLIKEQMSEVNALYESKRPPVQVRTPDEADQLPRGRRFVTPDGRVLVAPGPPEKKR